MFVPPCHHSTSAIVFPDWCDDIDFGSDFLKMGGVEFLSRYINSQHSGLRWRILDLMATILQNNEWAQNEARSKVIGPSM